MLARIFSITPRFLAAAILFGADGSAQRDNAHLVTDGQRIDDRDLSAIPLDDDDEFGSSLVRLGDLNGDGIGDFAVGARRDDDGSTDQGAVWILFPRPDGSIASYKKIGDYDPDFSGALRLRGLFGSSLTPLGDLDGDGVVDLAVGAMEDDDGAASAGAVWILFLDPDGSVKNYQKISARAGGFSGTLEARDRFGSAVAVPGDLDGDGIIDLAVGAVTDGSTTGGAGAVWVLFMNRNGTVKSHQEISASAGGFGGALDPYDGFGASLATIGDFDGDGTGDLAVGADEDDDGDDETGAVWILLLNPNGTVKSHQKISAVHGGFSGTILGGDLFGSSISPVADLDGDGILDLAVGARGSYGGTDLPTGALWVLLLQTDGTVKSQQKISDLVGGFGDHLDSSDRFGYAAAFLDDFNADGIPDLAGGAPGHDGAAERPGAVWILGLAADGTCLREKEVGTVPLSPRARLGGAVAAAGDLDGNGSEDLFVGAPENDDPGEERGTVWTVLLGEEGEVLAQHRIGEGQGGFTASLDDGDRFGADLTRFTGFADLAGGAPGDDDGGNDRGAVWLLGFDSPGWVCTESKISALRGGSLATLDDEDGFGTSVTRLPDLDGDGIDELAVGAPGDDDGAVDAGAVWILFFDAFGAIRREQKISATAGAFGGPLNHNSNFGMGVAGIGDYDGDGLEDLAVGSPWSSVGTYSGGAVWFLSLDSDGTVKGEWVIARGLAGLGSGWFGSSDRFGSAVGSASDLDGDGKRDLIIGAPNYGNSGAALLVALDPSGMVRSTVRIGSGSGGLPTMVLDSYAAFGAAVGVLNEFDAVEKRRLVVGAPSRAVNAPDRGSTYLLSFRELAYASATARNGTGVNPAIFTSTSLPRIGTDWTSEVDAASIGAGGFVFVFVYALGHPGLPLLFGEILLDPSSPQLATDWTVAYGGVSHHEIAIPYDLALYGATASAQGYLSDVAPSGKLTNAIDLVFGE